MAETERVHSSWADEVEREAEEEKTTAQSHQIPKPNPFGSARPREVILQERGIDWRKLDLHLHQSTPTRQVNSRKENTPACVVKQNRRLKAEKLGFNQSAEIAVPPLRYPPRNMVASLSESRFACNPSCFEVQQRSFQCKSSSAPGKTNSIRTNGSRNSATIESMEKGRNSRKIVNHGYRVNASGSLLGKHPVEEEAVPNIGVLRSKTLQRW